MKFQTRRGVVDPVTLTLICGLALGYFLGGWKPMAMFKKEPPTKQLTELQAKLDATAAEAEKARLAREAAVVAERAKLEAQVRGAQIDNTGVVTALRKVPAGLQSPEVKLASRMATRVDIKLATAIGRLPEADQIAMVELIEQALSDKQAEIDDANRKLAEADANFKVLSGERDQLKVQIPILTEKVKLAEATVVEVQAEVTVVTNKVKARATELFNEQQKSGSFSQALSSSRNFIIGLGVLIVIGAGALLYLRMGLGSVGRALSPLQNVLSDDDYKKVVSQLDGETDKLHQWLISKGRKGASL